jgi:protein-tyrosine kinase
MSRVFEALTKASHERESGRKNANKESGRDANPIEPATPQAITFGNITSGTEWSIGRNGKHSEVPASSVPSPIATQSWRERLEQLFFDWDLRRYWTRPIVALQGESPGSEQYKILREQLRRLRTDGGIRTIAVTSPVKRDGKTTVAVNLAAAIALEYEGKVLLVDADLRAPSVHRYFNCDDRPGLTDYLGASSYGGLKGLVRDTHLSGLRMIPAGKPTRFAPELLAKEKMRRLFEEIQTELPDHMVIIDSPPALSTPDPLVLSRQVDGVIIVIRAGKTPKDHLARALSSFEGNKVLGVVFNGAELGWVPSITITIPGVAAGKYK